MEFTFIIIVLPLVVVVASIIGYVLVKKWFVMPIVTFVVFLILMLTIFNSTFFIWVLIYTMLSIVVSFPMKKLNMLNK